MFTEDEARTIARRLADRGLYVRFQGRGKSIFGFTSVTSIGNLLQEKHVFAYPFDEPAQAQEWFEFWKPGRDEAVVFKGKREYDPGDVEGLAVEPTREIMRMTLREWLQVAKFVDDPDNMLWYEEMLEDLVDRERRG